MGFKKLDVHCAIKLCLRSICTRPRKEAHKSIKQLALKLPRFQAHKKDLEEATKALESLRALREGERNTGQDAIKRADARIGSILAPAMAHGSSRLDQLVNRRVALEAFRSEEVQATSLRDLKDRIEGTAKGGVRRTKEWEPLPSTSLRKFCDEIEAVLKEWQWDGKGRVEFDESEYDIKVEGQRRQSHGKGVRAILHSAFVIGLLRYCQSNGKPHLGTVVIDSPLTSYKKGKAGESSDVPVSAGIENAFWQSLRSIEPSIQVIVIENKEPPSDVRKTVHYEWFAGKNAQRGERQGFIPARR